MRPADIEDVDTLQIGVLDELRAVGREELAQHPRGLAARVRLELVLLTILPERLRPRLEWHLVTRRRNVSETEARGPEDRLLRVAVVEDDAARRVSGSRGSWRTRTASVCMPRRASQQVNPSGCVPICAR